MGIFDRVKELCELKGINVSQLEKEIGISQGAAYKWRTSSPSKKMFEKLSDYFGVSIDFLMTGEEKKKTERPKELYTKEDLELLALIKKLNEKQRNLIVETIKSFAPQND